MTARILLVLTEWKFWILLFFSNVLICNNLFSGNLTKFYPNLASFIFHLSQKCVKNVLMKQTRKQDYFFIFFMPYVNLEALNLSSGHPITLSIIAIVSRLAGNSKISCNSWTQMQPECQVQVRQASSCRFLKSSHLTHT